MFSWGENDRKFSISIIIAFSVCLLFRILSLQHLIKLAKILLVLKCTIYFSNIDFSLVLQIKLLFLIFFASFYISVFCFLTFLQLLLFFALKAIKRRKVTLIATAQTFAITIILKIDNYGESKQEKKQIRLRATTLQGATEKSQIFCY